MICTLKLLWREQCVPIVQVYVSFVATHRRWTVLASGPILALYNMRVRLKLCNVINQVIDEALHSVQLDAEGVLHGSFLRLQPVLRLRVQLMNEALDVISLAADLPLYIAHC